MTERACPTNTKLLEILSRLFTACPQGTPTPTPGRPRRSRRGPSVCATSPTKERAFVASDLGAGSVTAHGGLSRSVSQWTEGMRDQGRWRRKNCALVSGDCVTMICTPLVCAAGIIIVQPSAEVRLVVE